MIITPSYQDQINTITSMKSKAFIRDIYERKKGRDENVSPNGRRQRRQRRPSTSRKPQSGRRRPGRKPQSGRRRP